MHASRCHQRAPSHLMPQLGASVGQFSPLCKRAMQRTRRIRRRHLRRKGQSCQQTAGGTHTRKVDMVPRNSRHRERMQTWRRSMKHQPMRVCSHCAHWTQAANNQPQRSQRMLNRNRHALRCCAWCTAVNRQFMCQCQGFDIVGCNTVQFQVAKSAPEEYLTITSVPHARSGGLPGRPFYPMGLARNNKMQHAHMLL